MTLFKSSFPNCRQGGARRCVPLRDGVPHQLAASGQGAETLQPHAAGRPAARLQGRGALQVAYQSAESEERQVRWSFWYLQSLGYGFVVHSRHG